MVQKRRHSGKELKTVFMMGKLQEQKWQAEDDARTMAVYQEILGDKARMQRAVKVAKRQAADLSKRANAMQSVAKTKANGFSRGGKVSTGRRKKQ